MKIEYTKHRMWACKIWIAKYKSCEAHLAMFDKEMNIQFIGSQEKGKGHCQQLVSDLKRWCKLRGLTLVSSQPISDVWRAIAIKNNLKIYELE